MQLSAVKKQLEQVNELKFRLPDGSYVSRHFHITEVGVINKKFIDCGGTLRNEEVVSFQLWEANDYDHRLAPKKLLDIIHSCENKLNIQDAEVEVEYQAATIGKYGLDFDGSEFVLTTKQTDCLAKDKCDVPPEKQKVELSELQKDAGCTPGGGCC